MQTTQIYITVSPGDYGPIEARMHEHINEWMCQTVQQLTKDKTVKSVKAAFSFYALHIRNKLTETLMSAPTLSCCKSGLKTFLFTTAFY